MLVRWAGLIPGVADSDPWYKSLVSRGAARQPAANTSLRGRQSRGLRDLVLCGRKQVAPAAKTTYPPGMPFVDPKNPNRTLTEAEIRAIIARGEADIEAGRFSDLDELLAEWQEEDEADRRACLRGKPAA